MAIRTRASLIKHLQWALELEHTTIPPYLCALYSIHDGANPAAATLIRNVVMEEMLHMTLAANLLNAVGGHPRLKESESVRQGRFPGYLPHSDRTVWVQLLPFSVEAIDTFCRIERPAPAKAPPQGNRYHTIGQFYEAIADGFAYLAHREKTLFIGRKDLQVSGSRYYYGGGGEPIAVTDLDSAREALREIVEQGEGSDDSIMDDDQRFGQVDELAHYYRFNEIRAGRRYQPGDSPRSGPTGPEMPVDWTGRYPMRPNPRVSKFRGHREIQRLMLEFNRGYAALLGALDLAFNGSPSALVEAVPVMYQLKYRAQELMAIPTGDPDGSTAGPSFEYAP